MERPILFSGEMVRAILAGWKTQTRRIIRLPDGYEHGEVYGYEGCHGGLHALACDPGPSRAIRCPYGAAGDRLWVRETFHRDWEHNRYFYRADADDDGRTVPYLVSGAGGIGGGIGDAVIDKWTPSIHMPRRASRLTLEVVAVQVERLQDITEVDAMAEGVQEVPLQADQAGAWWTLNVEAGAPLHGRTPVEAFRKGWDSINGKRAPWASNPWVWVINFKPV